MWWISSVWFFNLVVIVAIYDLRRNGNLDNKRVVLLKIIAVGVLVGVVVLVDVGDAVVEQVCALLLVVWPAWFLII